MAIPHTEILVPVVVGGSALLAMTFTPNDIVSVFGALGILIAAIATAYSTIIAARMKAVASTAAETLDKVKVVEGHVNSAATKAAGIIAAQEAQMVLLRETIETQKQTAALLAQSLVSRSSRSTDATVPDVKTE